MFNQDTGSFSEGNIPREYRDQYRRSTGYGTVRELAQWEKDLLDHEVTKLKQKLYGID